MPEHLRVRSLRPQTPGGARPRSLASSHKLGRPVGLAARWSRAGSPPARKHFPTRVFCAFYRRSWATAPRFVAPSNAGWSASALLGFAA